MYSTGHSCHILMKLEFSQQILEKYSIMKFYKNPPSGSRDVPCGQTDRQDVKKLKVALRSSLDPPINSVQRTERFKTLYYPTDAQIHNL